MNRLRVDVSILIHAQRLLTLRILLKRLQFAMAMANSSALTLAARLGDRCGPTQSRLPSLGEGIKFVVLIKHPRGLDPAIEIRPICGMKSFQLLSSRRVLPTGLGELRSAVEAQDWFERGLDSRTASGSSVIRSVLRKPWRMLTLSRYISRTSFVAYPTTSDFMVELVGSTLIKVSPRLDLLRNAHFANESAEHAMPSDDVSEIAAIDYGPLHRRLERSRRWCRRQYLGQVSPPQLANVAAAVGWPELATPLYEETGHPSVAQVALQLVSGADPSNLHDVARVVNSCTPADDGTTQPLTSHQVFQPRLVTMREVEVWHGRYLVKGPDLILHESGQDPRLVTVAGSHSLLWGTSVSNKAIIKAPRGNGCHIKEAIYLCGRADTNWFHWITETLPAICYLDEATSADTPILMRDDLPPAAYQALRSISNRPLELTGLNQQVSVGRLHMWVHRAVFYDSAWATRLPPAFNADALLRLRERFSANLAERPTSKISRASALRSSAYRNITNRRAVESILSSAGFVSIKPERQGFVTQYATFQDAEEVVIQAGAGMANLTFMRPGSKVTILVSDAHGFAQKWAQLLDILGLEGRFVVGAATSRAMGAHSDFHVPLHSLRSALASK